VLILSIETSCDETAISLVEASGDFPHATYEILGNALWSQIDIHREYGGVFPAIAKREHAATIVSMLEKAIKESGMEAFDFTPTISPETERTVREILSREVGLADNLLTFHKEHGSFAVDLIAVTNGPGLEPALWVGVNFAKALAILWNVNVVPVNHMEGHVLSSIYDIDRDNQLSDISFPAISLLISGGHTELLLMKNWSRYEKIGQTRDDAVGEAYDKVARLLGLPYPGGPEIAKKAMQARKEKLPPFATFPTPMLNSGDLDFSFSGLKTAVRYAVQGKVNAEGREDALEYKELSENDICAISRDFEDAVATVLLKKSTQAVEAYDAKTLIVGGGVSANTYLKQRFDAAFLTDNHDVEVYFPQPSLTTDNSIMIALAGHAKKDRALTPISATTIAASGNLSIATE
jgi:N6-L-threonylcarbamoyladenine synthase